MPDKFKIKELAFHSLWLVLFIFLSLPVLPHLYERFTAHESYYSHGFLVPFISMFLIWQKRANLAAINKQPSLVGIFLTVICSSTYIVSLALKINFLSYFSLWGLLVGIIISLQGLVFARKIAFPLFFLIFMLPLPRVAILAIAFKMKMFAAASAAFIAQKAGLEIIRNGSTIYYPGGQLIVGDPCSGLRSLISFLALGILYVYLVPAGKIKKAIIFLSVVPVALFSNILRILFLLLVSYIYGEEAIVGFVHDASGIAVFIVGFFIFLAISSVLGVNFGYEPRKQ